MKGVQGNKLNWKKRVITKVAYNDWLAKHQPKCTQNFRGTSGAMEEEEATRMWSRNLAKKLQYNTFIGDGDSNAHKAVDILRPYGAIDVVKEECKNHVKKRMGTALWKLRDDYYVLLTTKAGNPKKSRVMKNVLVDAVINNLEYYYRRAISSTIDVGGSVEDRRKSVYATFLHITSTKGSKDHYYCPKGLNSWCFWQKHVFLSIMKKGKEDASPVKRPTRSNPRTVTLDLQGDEKEALRQVYLRLSEETPQQMPQGEDPKP